MSTKRSVETSSNILLTIVLVTSGEHRIALLFLFHKPFVKLIRLLFKRYSNCAVVKLGETFETVACQKIPGLASKVLILPIIR
jgi:hypothetical protein